MVNDWIEIWINDKLSMMETMRSNLAADIKAGYDLNGYSVRKQIIDIEVYERQYNLDMDKIRDMDPGKAKHWCYIDLKKRGVIG